MSAIRRQIEETAEELLEIIRTCGPCTFEEIREIYLERHAGERVDMRIVRRAIGELYRRGLIARRVDESRNKLVFEASDS